MRNPPLKAVLVTEWRPITACKWSTHDLAILNKKWAAYGVVASTFRMKQSEVFFFKPLPRVHVQLIFNFSCRCWTLSCSAQHCSAVACRQSLKQLRERACTAAVTCCHRRQQTRLQRASPRMDALRALSPASRSSNLQALPRVALQKLAKEAGLRVRPSH